MKSNLSCCQNTSSPIGKLCPDCPNAQVVKKSFDILDPAEIAAGMKKQGLHGDEPFPGYSNGRKLVEKEHDPTMDYYAPYVPPGILDIDFSKLEERALAHLHCGGPVTGRLNGRGTRYDLSPGGTEYDSLHAHDDTEEHH